MNRQRGFTTYIIAGLLFALAVAGLLLNDDRRVQDDVCEGGHVSRSQGRLQYQ